MPLGALATLSDNLPLMIFGVGLVTAGIFRRPLDRFELDRSARGEGAGAGERALSVLLLSRLERGGHARRLGSRPGGMAGVAAFVGILAAAALAVALRLSRVPPPAHLRS